MPRCQYCDRDFTSNSVLTRHQKQTNYCIAIQKKCTTRNFCCSHCGNTFTRNSSLTRHLKICAKAQSNNKIKEQIVDLKQQIQDMKQPFVPTSVKPDADNNRVMVNNLQPMNNEQLQEQIKKLTLEFILAGARGFADFARGYPFKGRVLCNDKSRKKFSYREDNGEIVVDSGGYKLAHKFFQAIATKNEELINQEYSTLLQKVQHIASQETSENAGLTEILKKATKLQDTLLQCNDAAEGKPNQMAEEFIRFYTKYI